MSSRTKIVVLHMKEIIYTAIFAALALLVIVLLIFMFGTGKKDSAVKNEKQYTPGTYTSTLTLNNTNLEVEVSVDAYKSKNGSVKSDCRKEKRRAGHCDYDDGCFFGRDHFPG